MIRLHPCATLRPALAAIVMASALPALAQPQPVVQGGPRGGEQVYRETCYACHDTGVARAPRLGDRTAWAALIDEGLPLLVAHGWVGVRAMPPKGGNPDLTPAEFACGVIYMANQSGGNWKAPDVMMMRRVLKEMDRQLDLSIRETGAVKRDLRRQREALH